MLNFNGTIAHIISDKNRCYLNVMFSYEEEQDKIVIESITGNFEALEEQDIFKVIRYAILNENFKEAVNSTGSDLEFNYYMDDYFKYTNIERNSDVLVETTSNIDDLSKKLTKRKANI